MYAAQFEPAGDGVGGRFGLSHFARIAGALALPGTQRSKRRRVGRMSVAAHGVDDGTRATLIGARTGVSDWPDRDLRIAAVDAETGEGVCLTRADGVDVRDAVASSCAAPLIWPAVRVGGRVCVDGGIRSTANADCARGADRALLLSPISIPTSPSQTFARQLRRAGVCEWVVITPAHAARRASGLDNLDVGRRAAAAEAGLRQTSKHLARVRALWLDDA